MDNFKINFQKRLIRLSKLVVEYLKTLAFTDENQIIGKQLIRSITSVGGCSLNCVKDNTYKT